MNTAIIERKTIADKRKTVVESLSEIRPKSEISCNFCYNHQARRSILSIAKLWAYSILHPHQLSTYFFEATWSCQKTIGLQLRAFTCANNQFL